MSYKILVLLTCRFCGRAQKIMGKTAEQVEQRVEASEWISYTQFDSLMTAVCPGCQVDGKIEEEESW